MYRLLRAAELEGVCYRTVLPGVRAEDPWQDYLPATVESLRPTVLERGLLPASDLDAALAACRAHLAAPDTVFTAPTLVQVWGHVPAIA
jgi:hypothetical protein